VGEPIQFVAKQTPKRKPIQFSEKTVSSLQSNNPSSSSSSSTCEVSFKKRKFSKTNMRKREEND